MLTGNAAAGKAYFEGQGKCGSCHSATGDFAGIAKRYDPLTLQQRLLFPRSGGRGTPPIRPTQVTVTPPAGPPVSGNLDRIDDFTVSLRDADGGVSFLAADARLESRAATIRYAPHNELLDQYTDADIHNLGGLSGDIEMKLLALVRDVSVRLGAIALRTGLATYNGDYSGRRYSSLAQINASNVGSLSLAWVHRANTGVAKRAEAEMPRR